MITDEWLTIIEQAEGLTDKLLSSEVVESYYKAHEAVYSNKELAQSIREFANKKETYEEVQRFGRYHPDYRTIMKDIRLHKRALDMNELVAELRFAENDLQQLLDDISVILATSISPSIKVDAGNSTLFSTSSCGTGCGTGGGCSCSA